jgi:hypothetical protein
MKREYYNWISLIFLSTALGHAADPAQSPPVQNQDQKGPGWTPWNAYPNKPPLYLSPNGTPLPNQVQPGFHQGEKPNPAILNAPSNAHPIVKHGLQKRPMPLNLQHNAHPTQNKNP